MNEASVVDKIIERLKYFINKGGPDESEYDELAELWDLLPVNPDNGNLDKSVKDKLFKIFNQDFFEKTVIGFAYRKPHGYAGDFEIIDKLYRQEVNLHLPKWDRYLHAQDAPTAVRNRKAYFIDLAKNKTKQNKTIQILNIASGPCRDIKELFAVVQPNLCDIHCVEMDMNAINLAKTILGIHADSVTMHHKNIFRFATKKQFDLVWSAGLFDYFDDKTFVKLLSKIKTFCKPNGEIVIGNFSDFNPSRSLMEKLSDWFLHHRSPQNLIDLAVDAGYDKRNITIKSEPIGINLFLHIKM